MDTLSVTHAGPSLRAMATIEAKRFARHPVFLVGTAIALGMAPLMWVLSDGEPSSNLLSWPVVAAFFIGLPSLVVAARQVRSVDAAAEAMDTAPGTEARRTLAVAIACLVPFAAGLVWVAAMVLTAAVWEPYPMDWWFGTAPDWQVWGVLLALAPVACLGGGTLGVLVGRWLRFPGAPAVAILVTVVAVVLASTPADGDLAEWRLWAPWALFHSGTWPDGTQWFYEGNPAFYLLYQLCLCASAVVVAMWHDRTARTTQLKAVLGGVVVAGLVCLALAMTTGIQETMVSEPNPALVEK